MSDIAESMSSDERREYYTLPEQRVRVATRPGGRGACHVVVWSTFPASSWPGRWTRRAAERRALCGALGALAVGVDAEDWPTEKVMPDLADVTCRRCLNRAGGVKTHG